MSMRIALEYYIRPSAIAIIIMFGVAYDCEHAPVYYHFSIHLF